MKWENNNKCMMRNLKKNNECNIYMMRIVKTCVWENGAFHIKLEYSLGC